jgi:hypothetical protein
MIMKHLVKDPKVEFGCREFIYDYTQFRLLRIALDLNGNNIFEALKAFGCDVDLDVDSILIGWGPLAEQIVKGSHPWCRKAP